VVDGRVYFAVGVWPFMGTFVYALDAESGRVVWINDSTSFTFRRLPHYGSVAFSGLSPQGHLAVADNRLIVPGSRLSPAIFDRTTGEFLGYASGTGPAVAAAGEFGFAGGEIFDVDRGSAVRLDGLGHLGRSVFADDAWYTRAGVFDPRSIRTKKTTQPVPHGNPGMTERVITGSITKLGGLTATPWLRAGNRLVTARAGDIQVLDTAGKADQPDMVWQGQVDGTVSSVLAAAGRLFVVTEEGRIHCFGPKQIEPQTYDLPEPAKPTGNAFDGHGRAILQTTHVDDGYAMVWGLKDGGLVEALLRQSRLHVIAIDRDARKIDALRQRLDAAGLYGRRAAALLGEPTRLEFAPYMASLILSEDAKAAGFDKGAEFMEKLSGALRPYGGVACLALSGSQRDPLGKWFDQTDPAGFQVRQSGPWTMLVREGPLPGSAPLAGTKRRRRQHPHQPRPPGDGPAGRALVRRRAFQRTDPPPPRRRARRAGGRRPDDLSSGPAGLRSL